MYPRRRVIALGVVAFLVSLLAFLPARLALAVIPAPPALHISDVAGSLWHGQARIAPAQGEYAVSWDLQAWRLLLLGLGADMRISSAGMSAEGGVTLHPWARELVIDRGEIAGARLAGLFSGPGVTIDEPLRIHDVAISMSRTGEVTTARGEAAWGPGAIRISGRPDVLAVPALRGRLAEVGGNLHLVFDGEPAPDQVLATVDVDLRSDQLHLVILQRAADMVGLAEKGRRPPDSPLVELRQPLR